VSAEFFANFSADQVEEKDEIEKTLDEGGREVEVREEPEVVATEENYSCQSHCPGPAKEHEQSAGGCEEEDGEDEEEPGIVSADRADDDDDREQKEIERERDETREREEFAPGWRRWSRICDGVGFVGRHRNFG